IKQNFNGKQCTNYKRELNLEQAVATTNFMVDGTDYKREFFTSAPDQVLVIRLSSSKKNALSFDVSGNSPLNNAMTASETALIISGKAPAHVDPSYYNPAGREPVIYEEPGSCKGMRYQFNVRAVVKDGTVSTDTSGIKITAATEVTLYVSAATSFNGFDKCPDSDGVDEKLLVNNAIKDAVNLGYAKVLLAHKKDYDKYFNRVVFSIKDTSSIKARPAMPSDERLKAYATGKYDPGVEELYYQYGRYLLISSSRKGGQPANLQGIWNKELRAPWSSNYTININTQMNYWPAGVANLIEMQQPLNDWLQSLAKSGEQTASEYYKLKGWVAHHNSDIWALSNAVGDVGHGDPVWANWYMGGNWLSRHLWEYYLYTGDKKFLGEKAFPVMKSAVEFVQGWLVKDKNGKLVTAPSTSPENQFYDANGKAQAVTAGGTMDLEIVHDLLSNTLEAAKILGVGPAYQQSITETINNLLPLQVGSKGQLLEWAEELNETDPKHRHTSHLYGLHPGHMISPVTTPKYADAAAKTLGIRGDEGTGWSKGWKINFWARLHDGDHAYKLIRELLKYVDVSGTTMTGGGTYPNFFDAHPPFQIDGNFAGTAGMSEMLLQTHDGAVHIFPALPSAWPAGTVKGLLAHGGFEIVELSWKDSRITRLIIRSKLGGNLRLRLPSAMKGAGFEIKNASGKNPNMFFDNAPEAVNDYKHTVLYDVNTTAGKSYEFK
ncbi:MAG: glycoside hydrolase family 95 protein, partial [Chitinophagaceae bacterium]